MQYSDSWQRNRTIARKIVNNARTPATTLHHAGNEVWGCTAVAILCQHWNIFCLIFIYYFRCRCFSQFEKFLTFRWTFLFPGDNKLEGYHIERHERFYVGAINDFVVALTCRCSESKSLFYTSYSDHGHTIGHVSTASRLIIRFIRAAIKIELTNIYSKNNAVRQTAHGAVFTEIRPRDTGARTPVCDMCGPFWILDCRILSIDRMLQFIRCR